MATKYDGLIYSSEKKASNRITDMTFDEFVVWFWVSVTKEGMRVHLKN